jgi:hypothetical protein
MLFDKLGFNDLVLQNRFSNKPVFKTGFQIMLFDKLAFTDLVCQNRFSNINEITIKITGNFRSNKFVNLTSVFCYS